jgi:hypothetical protein
LKNGELRGLLDEKLSKTIDIEDLIMEEKIKSRSKFVIKESFDFGNKKYYKNIAHSVANLLKQKGISQKENKWLL